MTQSAAPFIPIEDVDWNKDDTVLRHEVAHALVWFHHGGGIGPLRAVRELDGLMMAAVKTGPRPDQTDTPDFVDAAAERLLAGEVASRVHLGLPGGRIALRRFSGSTFPKGITAKDLAETATENLVHPGGRQILEDVAKVLLMAHDYHPERWRTWIGERLAASEGLVRANWAHIEAVATTYFPCLPITLGTSAVIASGAELIREFDRLSVPVRGARPIEIH